MQSNPEVLLLLKDFNQVRVLIKRRKTPILFFCPVVNSDGRQLLEPSSPKPIPLDTLKSTVRLSHSCIFHQFMHFKNEAAEALSHLK